MTTKITLRDSEAVIRALAAGLTPRQGAIHLIVGHLREIEAQSRDLEIIKDGGASFRIIVGRYGSGKTLMQQVIKLLAIKEGLVVLQADLTTNLRLHGTDGKGRNLITECLRNLSTKAVPEGDGLQPLIEGFISKIHSEVTGKGGNEEAVWQEIEKSLRNFTNLVGGYEFMAVIKKYYEGFTSEKPELQDSALRWLRAEFSTKTEAREQLGVRRIVSDEEVYNHLKLFAAFCRIAGYGGLLVLLDELVTLTHRLPNSKSRLGSFQVILHIINDCLQGNVQGLGFMLAATPECLEDPERGLFSYPPLRTRLQTYGHRGTVDYSGPVIRLAPLGIEELMVLLQNIRRVQALGDESKFLVPDEGLKVFVDKIYAKLGEKSLGNPRQIVRPFVTVLNILKDNPDRLWQDIMSDVVASIAKPSTETEKELESLDLNRS